MKVSVFVDRFTVNTQFSVNSIYALTNYNKSHTPSATYTLGQHESLYLIGGRASIAEYCRSHPFKITYQGTRPLVMQMVRGVPGISNKERVALGLKEEPLMSRAIGVFKSKTLTVLQIQSGTPDEGGLALMRPSSDCIPELIALFEATMTDAMGEAMGFSSSGFSSAHAARKAHNDRYATRGVWDAVPLPK